MPEEYTEDEGNVKYDFMRWIINDVESSGLGNSIVEAVYENKTYVPVYTKSYKVSAPNADPAYYNEGYEYELPVPDDTANFSGWNINGIFTAYAEGKTITITEPTTVEFVYSNAATYKVTVEGGNIIGSDTDMITVPAGTNVTVVASIIDYEFFDYWAVDNQIVSRSPIYTFKVTQKTTITARYNNERKTVGQVTGAAGSDASFTFNAGFTAPEGAKLTYASIIATTKDSVGYNLSYSNCSYLKGKSNPTLTGGIFTLDWTRNNVKEGQTWYVRTYFKYTLDGTTYKAYGDVVAVQLVDGQLVCVNPLS